jgi:hypothetical protein
LQAQSSATHGRNVNRRGIPRPSRLAALISAIAGSAI